MTEPMPLELAQAWADVVWKYRAFRLQSIRQREGREKWNWNRPPLTTRLPYEVRALLQHKIDRVREEERRFVR